MIIGELLVAGGLRELLAAEALQAEEAGGIAFIDGDFEVSGGIEQGQFGAFRNIGIGFTDLADHFIAAEEDPELPVPALLIELLPGDVHHYIFEAVDMNDLPFDEIVAHEWLQVMFYLYLLGHGAEFTECFAAAQLPGSGSEQLDDGKSIFRCVGRQGSLITFSGMPPAIMVSSPLSAQPMYWPLCSATST